MKSKGYNGGLRDVPAPADYDGCQPPSPAPEYPPLFDCALPPWSANVQAINHTHAGVIHRLRPAENPETQDPVILAAGAEHGLIFQCPNNLWYNVIAGMAVVKRTADANIGIPSKTYAVNIQIRDLGDDYRTITNGTSPLEYWFGTGEWRSWMPIPHVMAPTARMEVRLFNVSGVPLSVQLRLAVQWKDGAYR